MAQSSSQSRAKARRVTARFSELVTAAMARIEAQRSRALVPLTPQKPPEDDLDKFSGLGATFLAHLIAMRDRAPQTRTRSRGATDEAISSYEHAAPHEEGTIPIKDS
jgi:hypothetical protein